MANMEGREQKLGGLMSDQGSLLLGLPLQGVKELVWRGQVCPGGGG